MTSIFFFFFNIRLYLCAYVSSFSLTSCASMRKRSPSSGRKKEEEEEKVYDTFTV